MTMYRTTATGLVIEEERGKLDVPRILAAICKRRDQTITQLRRQLAEQQAHITYLENRLAPVI